MKFDPKKLEKGLAAIKKLNLAAVLKEDARKRVERQKKRRLEIWGS